MRGVEKTRHNVDERSSGPARDGVTVEEPVRDFTVRLTDVSDGRLILSQST